MSVLKVIELLASSTISWEDAQKAITKASKSLKVKSVYIKDQSAAVSEGISEYRVLKSDI
jgi:flavin-binding protein dodecin